MLNISTVAIYSLLLFFFLAYAGLVFTCISMGSCWVLSIECLTYPSIWKFLAEYF